MVIEMEKEYPSLSYFRSENEETYQILEKITEDDLVEANKLTHKISKEDGLEVYGHGMWSEIYLKYLVSDIRKMSGERKHFIEISAKIMQEIVRRGDAPQPFIDLNHRTAYSIIKWIYKNFGYKLAATLEELDDLRKKWDGMQLEEYIKWLIDHTKAANSLRVSSSISNFSANDVVI